MDLIPVVSKAVSWLSIISNKSYIQFSQ